MTCHASGGLFRRQLAEENADIWAAIDELPFITEAAKGTLDETAFATFIAQDVLYLDEFAKVLARGAVWAGDADTRQLFLQHAANVYNVEQALHEGIGKAIGLDIGAVRRQEPRPVTLAYTNHLHHAAETGPLLGLVGAVLPCYWIYRHVGERMAASPPDHPIYRQWCEAYASPEFGAAVDAQFELLERLAPTADAATLDRTRRWFRRSMRYEWMFWDQAYRQLDWPVG